MLPHLCMAAVTAVSGLTSVLGDPLQLGAVTEDPRIALRTTPEVKVAREVQPAVVYIECTATVQVVSSPFGHATLREQTRSGSGVVVDPRGYIITNRHVVQDALYRGVRAGLTVQFDESVDPGNPSPDKPRKWKAQLLSASPDHDLALLKVDSDLDLVTVKMGTSSDLMVGERVIAIGNPYGQRLTVSSGIISGLHRKLSVDAGYGVPLELHDLIQTDAAINQGNSGGPLLNILGELIGINTAVNQGAENMGFAIPVDRIQEVLRDQLLSADASRAWFGFDVEEAGTLCINKVVAGSPADVAGIEVGYRLVAVDGNDVRTAEDFRFQRALLLPNRPVRVRVAMPEGPREYELRGWDRVDGILYERMGLKVQPCALGGLRTQVQRSLEVADVQPGGPADELGLRRGDVIDAVMQRRRDALPYKFASPFELAQFVASLPASEVVDLDVLRDEDGDKRIDLANELFKGSLTLR